MTKLLKLVVVACLTFVVAACSKMAPISTPEYHSGEFTINKIEKAILNTDDRGWVFKKDAPGLITGTLVSRGNTVKVKVPYTSTGYKIEFDSSNLAKNGEIHRNYNRWVTNLDQDIQRNLNLLR